MVINVCFSAKKLIFMCFIFIFVSLVPSTLYPCSGISFFGLILEQKNENQTPPLHSIETEASHKPYLTIWQKIDFLVTIIIGSLYQIHPTYLLMIVSILLQSCSWSKGGKATLQWISVVLENSVDGVSCPDNKQYTLLILSGHKTSSMEFSNATEIHCTQYSQSPGTRTTKRLA